MCLLEYVCAYGGGGGDIPPGQIDSPQEFSLGDEHFPISAHSHHSPDLYDET